MNIEEIKTDMENSNHIMPRRKQLFLIAEVERLRAKLKPFPMQDGPDIPWSTAEKIYKIYSELYGTQQSLERIAERAGFGWAEVACLVEKFKKRKWV